MTSRSFPAWMWAVALLGALLSLFSILKRNEVESSNRSVALAVEMENIQALAAAQGITVPQALQILKRDGLQSVVLSEEGLSQLVSEGRASEVNGKLKILDPTVQPRVTMGLKLRIPNGDFDHAPVWLVRGVSIGLSPEEAQQSQQAGLSIVARCSNVVGATDDYIRGTLGWARKLGATVFLPQGDQVLGRRDQLKTTVDTLKQIGMLYATPEFTKISGDDTVLKMAPEMVVRLHSAQSAELDRMSVDDAVERYSKAARERNMRILLVRPLSFAGERPVEDFGAFLDSIRSEVNRQGNHMGAPAPFHEPGIPRFLPVLIALCAVPVAYWIGWAVFPWKWAGPAFGGLMFLLALASITKTGSQLGALAASMAYPTAALLSLDFRKLTHPLLDFLTTTLFSWVGGLSIAGMLNGLPYYVRAEVFPGVKLSVFLPIALVAAYYFIRLTPAKDQIQSPITWRTAALGMITLGALAFMIARTGNDASAGVSGLELQFRNILDRVLIVRPRTKEFMIGHPALILGIGLLAYARANPGKLARLGPWITLAIMMGAIGQTSVVNTMCHLHTPVVLSLARITEGIVIGSIIGLVLWAIVKRFLLRPSLTHA